MGPNTIFDKSVFEAMSMEERRRCWSAVNENVTPILLKEIVSDLSKEVANPQALVSALARKFGGSGGVINMDWQLPCCASLDGQEQPMTGQVLIDHGIYDHATSSMLIQPTAGNVAIMRWAEKAFSASEEAFAERFRRQAAAFEICHLRGRLDTVSLPVAKAIERIPEEVDKVLDDDSVYPILLDWLCDQLRHAGVRLPVSIPRLRIFARGRWYETGRCHLRDFAPYAAHCARALLMLVIGSNVLSRRPTNRLDAEYLLYLPFCKLFVSGDSLHRQLTPFLLRPYQRFMMADAFRTQLASGHPFSGDEDD